MLTFVHVLLLFCVASRTSAAGKPLAAQFPVRKRESGRLLRHEKRSRSLSADKGFSSESGDTKRHSPRSRRQQQSIDSVLEAQPEARPANHIDLRGASFASSKHSHRRQSSQQSYLPPGTVLIKEPASNAWYSPYKQYEPASVFDFAAVCGELSQFWLKNRTLGKPSGGGWWEAVKDVRDWRSGGGPYNNCWGAQSRGKIVNHPHYFLGVSFKVTKDAKVRVGLTHNSSNFGHDFNPTTGLASVSEERMDWYLKLDADEEHKIAAFKQSDADLVWQSSTEAWKGGEYDVFAIRLTSGHEYVEYCLNDDVLYRTEFNAALLPLKVTTKVLYGAIYDVKWQVDDTHVVWHSISQGIKQRWLEEGELGVAGGTYSDAEGEAISFPKVSLTSVVAGVRFRLRAAESSFKIALVPLPGRAHDGFEIPGDKGYTMDFNTNSEGTQITVASGLDAGGNSNDWISTRAHQSNDDWFEISVSQDRTKVLFLKNTETLHKAQVLPEYYPMLVKVALVDGPVMDLTWTIHEQYNCSWDIYSSRTPTIKARQWCCKHHRIGCNVIKAEFDCVRDSPHGNFEMRQYCCNNHNQHCWKVDQCMPAPTQNVLPRRAWMGMFSGGGCGGNGDKADCGIFPESKWKSGQNFRMLTSNTCDNTTFYKSERISTIQSCIDAFRGLGFDHADLDVKHDVIPSSPPGCLLRADDCTLVLNLVDAEESTGACNENVTCFCREKASTDNSIEDIGPKELFSFESEARKRGIQMMGLETRTVAVEGCSSSDQLEAEGYVYLAPKILHRSQTANVLCCGQDGTFCESSSVGCLQDKTYWQAEAECEKVGLRLCSKMELLSGICCGAGCTFDGRLVWSSTDAVRYNFTLYAQGTCTQKANETYAANNVESCQDTCNLITNCSYMQYRDQVCHMYDNCTEVNGSLSENEIYKKDEWIA